MKKSVMVSALILALVPMAMPRADLTSVVGRLRAQPLSLFDWGMYRLQTDVQRVLRDERDFVRVVYEPGAQRIVVDATFVVLQEEIEAITARTACYKRHHAIKLLLGVIDTSRVHFAPASDYRFGLKFSHQDPETLLPEPDVAALGKQLMAATTIRVAISSQVMEFPFSPDLRCSGDLVSQEVAYSDDVEP